MTDRMYAFFYNSKNPFSTCSLVFECRGQFFLGRGIGERSLVEADKIKTTFIKFGENNIPEIKNKLVTFSVAVEKIYYNYMVKVLKISIEEMMDNLELEIIKENNFYVFFGGREELACFRNNLYLALVGSKEELTQDEDAKGKSLTISLLLEEIVFSDPRLEC